LLCIAAHSPHTRFTKRFGAFFCNDDATESYSQDGLHWEYGGLAYTNNVSLTDGGWMLLNRRERPHLVFHEGTRTPAALSNSAEAGALRTAH
jgi:hypothetical protein